jgi:hypothetical protein
MMKTVNSFPSYIFGTKHDWYVIDLFCAGFLGGNTTRHIVPHSKKYYGIDNDPKKLSEIRELYKNKSVVLFNADIYTFLDNCKESPAGIVISDQPTSHNAKLYRQIESVLSLATEWAVIGTNIDDAKLLPLESSGFYLQCLWSRSEHMGGTYWAVYKKI